MSRRLQLDVRNLSLGMCHLVNAYEVKAGIAVIAGNTVWSMRERLAGTTKWALYKYTYLYLYLLPVRCLWVIRPGGQYGPPASRHVLFFYYWETTVYDEWVQWMGVIARWALLPTVSFSVDWCTALTFRNMRETDEGHSRSLVIGVCVCVRVWQCQRAWE